MLAPAWPLRVGKKLPYVDLRLNAAAFFCAVKFNKEGFCIEGAEKGKGSVEDGIEFIRSFEEIIIHPRCKGTKDNFENYKWKQDKITGEILPIPAEGSDHAPDAVRYALEPYIKKKVTIFDVL